MVSGESDGLTHAIARRVAIDSAGHQDDSEFSHAAEHDVRCPRDSCPTLIDRARRADLYTTGGRISAARLGTFSHCRRRPKPARTSFDSASFGDSSLIVALSIASSSLVSDAWFWSTCFSFSLGMMTSGGMWAEVH